MTTTTDVQRPDDQPGPSGDIVAKPGMYYRVTRYIITAVMVGMGLWFGYDGFVNWPESNRKWDAIEQQRREAESAGDRDRSNALKVEQDELGRRYTDWDLLLQRLLFFTLPPIGLAMLVRWVWISRGTYRLTADNVLHVPGHPPVPLESVVELDKRLWDRKGIAYVGYEIPGGTQGRLKLDDFIYDREPTDEIFKRIEAHVAPPAPAEPASEETPQEQSAG